MRTKDDLQLAQIYSESQGLPDPQRQQRAGKKSRPSIDDVKEKVAGGLRDLCKLLVATGYADKQQASQIYQEVGGVMHAAINKLDQRSKKSTNEDK